MSINRINSIQPQQNNPFPDPSDISGRIRLIAMDTFSGMEDSTGPAAKRQKIETFQFTGRFPCDIDPTEPPAKRQKTEHPQSPDTEYESYSSESFTDGLDPALRAEYEKLIAPQRKISTLMANGGHQQPPSSDGLVKDLVNAKELLRNDPHLSTAGLLRIAYSLIRAIDKQLDQLQIGKSQAQLLLEGELKEVTETIENIESALSSLSDDERKEFSEQLAPLKERKQTIEQILFAPIDIKIRTLKAVIIQDNRTAADQVEALDKYINQENDLVKAIEIATEDFLDPMDLNLKFKALSELQSTIKRLEDEIREQQILTHQKTILFLKLQLSKLESQQKIFNSAAIQTAILEKKDELREALEEKANSEEDIPPLDASKYLALLELASNGKYAECEQQLLPYLSDPSNFDQLLDPLLKSGLYRYIPRVLFLIQKQANDNSSQQPKVFAIALTHLISHLIDVIKTDDPSALELAFHELRTPLRLISTTTWNTCFLSLFNHPGYTPEQRLIVISTLFHSLEKHLMYGDKTREKVDNIISILLKDLIKSQRFEDAKAILFFLSERINSSYDIKNFLISAIVLLGKPLPFPIFPENFFHHLSLTPPGSLFNKTHFELVSLMRMGDLDLFSNILQNQGVSDSIDSGVVQIILYSIAQTLKTESLSFLLIFLQNHPHLFDSDVQKYLFSLYGSKRFGYQTLIRTLDERRCHENSDLKNFICQTKVEQLNGACQESIVEPPQPPILSLVNAGNFPALFLLIKIYPQLFTDQNTLQTIFEDPNWSLCFGMLYLSGTRQTQTLIDRMITDHPNRESEFEEAKNYFKERLVKIIKQIPYYFNLQQTPIRPLANKPVTAHEEGSLGFLLALDQKQLSEWISRNFNSQIDRIIEKQFFLKMIERADWKTLERVVSLILEEHLGLEVLMQTPCAQSTIFGAFYFHAIETGDWHTVLKILHAIHPDYLKDFLNTLHRGLDGSIFKNVVQQLISVHQLGAIQALIDDLFEDDRIEFLSMVFDGQPLKSIINIQDDMEL